MTETQTEREKLADLFAQADRVDSGTWAIRELIVDGLKLGYEMAVADVEREVGSAGLATVGLPKTRRADIAEINAR